MTAATAARRPEQYSRTYSLPGFDFVLTTGDSGVLSLFDRAFGGLCGATARRPEIEYSVEVLDMGVALSHQGVPIGMFDDRRSAVDHLVWHVSHTALTRVSEGVALHGAGVALAGRGLVLVGRSGSGKSTLVVELLRRGMDYLSDEAVIISTSDATVRGFPRSIGLKIPGEEGGGIIHFPHSDTLLGHRGGHKAYYPPSQFGGETVSDSVRPAAVVFLTGAQEPTVLRQMTPVEAVPCLVEQVFASHPPELIFETLMKLASRVKLYSLQAGDPRVAAEALLDLLDISTGA